VSFVSLVLVVWATELCKASDGSGNHRPSLVRHILAVLNHRD